MSARGALDDPLDGPAANDMATVLDRMRAIVAILPRRDGLAAFTQLYVAVAEAVERELEEAKAELSSGIVGGVDVALGTLDDVVAMRDVERARDRRLGQRRDAVGAPPPAAASRPLPR